MPVRPAVVAGSWYPAEAGQLRAELETYLADAGAEPPPSTDRPLVAIIAPHAGLMYSGPVAAHAYRLLAGRSFDLVVLVGPSHFVAFDGVSIWPAGGFETPLGPLQVDEGTARDLLRTCAIVHDYPPAHAREHSLEMQLPFLAALAPAAPVLPLVMGHQTRETATLLSDGLAALLDGRRGLLIASSDLSHYLDARTAGALDAQVAGDVEALDDEGLMTRLEHRPEHACGGGPIVSVLRTARRLGATRGRVLRYADSGDVSGDKRSVVGYLSAAVWQ